MITRNFDAITSGARFVTKLSGQDVLVGGIRELIDNALHDAAQELAKDGAAAVVALVAA